MRQITARAPAKINLTLDVVGRRADGYHELKTVMQTVDRCDTLTVQAADRLSLTVRGAAPCPVEKNTVWRAATLFFWHCGLPGGAAMMLDKTIPQQAGMGGGSADAAATLLALDRLFGTALPAGELQALGAQIGADVPFCLLGGTAYATGVGERLQPLRPLPDLPIVIAQPAEGISTAQAYSAVDAAEPPERPDHAAALEAIGRGDPAALIPQMINVFEAATALPGVAAIRRAMTADGALVSRMTGSGSAVFGLFADETAAARCADRLSRCWPIAFVCHPCGGVTLQEKFV